MKTFKITYKDKQYKVKAKDKATAISALKRKLKDSRYAYAYVNENEVQESELKEVCGANEIELTKMDNEYRLSGDREDLLYVLDVLALDPNNIYDKKSVKDADWEKADKVREVLEENDILFGDTSIDGNKILIVGADPDYWQDIVDIVKDELGLVVELPCDPEYVDEDEIPDLIIRDKKVVKDDDAFDSRMNRFMQSMSNENINCRNEKNNDGSYNLYFDNNGWHKAQYIEEELQDFYGNKYERIDANTYRVYDRKVIKDAKEYVLKYPYPYEWTNEVWNTFRDYCEQNNISLFAGDDVMLYNCTKEQADKAFKLLGVAPSRIIERNMQDKKRVKDNETTIQYLIGEEQKAIKDYEKAIKETDKEVEKQLYRHILEEEYEHLDELTNLLNNKPLLDRKAKDKKIRDYNILEVAERQLHNNALSLSEYSDIERIVKNNGGETVMQSVASFFENNGADVRPKGIGWQIYIR